MSPTLRGALLATLALALVGSLVASADLVEGYPLPTGQALRYTLAALVLLAVARWRLPRLYRRETVGLIAMSATGLVLFNLFVIEGVRETDPATVGVIIGCVPVVLALAGPLMEGRALSPRVVAAAVVVAAGAAGVQWAGGGISLAGLMLALGALACEAGFSLLALPYLARLGPLALSTYACLFAVPMLAVWSVVANGPSLPLPDAEQAAALAYMGMGVTVLGFVSWYSAVGLLGVERAGLFSGVLPVSALACSALLGVAEVTGARLAAVVVVAAGITLGVRAQRGAPAGLGTPETPGPPARARREPGRLPNLSRVLLDSIDWLGHSGFRIRVGRSVVYIDPYRVPAGTPPADLILVTHGHYDHFSPRDIEQLSTERTWLVGPAAVAERVSGRVQSIAPGELIDEMVRGVHVAALAAYNTSKRDAEGNLFHPPDAGWVGYELNVRGERLYHSGDTDVIPEMDRVTGVDVALLPVSGVYVMTAQEAAEAARRIQPRVAVPMHWGEGIGSEADARAFAERAPVEVRVLEKAVA